MIDWLILWCLMQFSPVFQLHRGGHCTYPCLSCTSTSTPHNILPKPLATFPHNHYQNNAQWWERNELCCNDSHQSLQRILAEPGIKPATSCPQVHNGTDWAMGLGCAMVKSQTCHLTITWTIVPRTISSSSFLTIPPLCVCVWGGGGFVLILMVMFHLWYIMKSVKIFFSETAHLIIPPLRRRGVNTGLALSVLPSATNIFRHIFSATMHHSHFKLGMMLLIGVLQVAYRI